MKHVNANVREIDREEEKKICNCSSVRTSDIQVGYYWENTNYEGN